MILLFSSIIIFNILAYFNHKKITLNQIVHIWCFTIGFQLIFDLIISVKYEGYWYFTKAIDWQAIPAYFVLIPPVNVMFLNWFPFHSSLVSQIRYFIIWEAVLLFYEILALSPGPFGFFTYGWWNPWITVVVNPFLLLVLIGYYKLVVKLEAKLLTH